MTESTRVRRWLSQAPAPIVTLYSMTAAFSTYFCMYAYRKPFSAASYEGEHFLGTAVALKTAFVIAQILGYTLSKYVGIKLVSEAQPERRAHMLVGLVLAAQAALLLFAIVPAELKVVAIFLNGLPLGMVWGLVVGYLEGRRTSDLLLAGLCCSFIVASGAVKDAGLALMRWLHLSEYWMPFATGILFMPAFVVSVWSLHQIPRPSAQDIQLRSARAPMGGKERLGFASSFLLGLILLIAVYVPLTAYRDFRDNYGLELFAELGYSGTPALFSRTEVPVAVGVMISIALLSIVRDNRRAVLGIFLLMLTGCGVLIVSTLLLQAGLLSGFLWMMAIGLGSYFIYVPYNSVLFDRIMAHTRAPGTAVFAIYLADALGYTGSVVVQLLRDFFDARPSRLAFFQTYTYAVAAFGLLALSAACIYFVRKGPRPA